ncbi:MAG: HAD family hydrolase [Cellvibrio sp.]|uniref:HAD family hydrolase n=1 Tax=Cellvibrio sp. TaxID=1965322 RepID=UPI00271C9B49|nr:HAD family hydrolase [Cellvibrio sp.]
MMQPGAYLLAAAADIRLAFFDIDGTLLDSHGQIHPHLYAAIASLKSKGIKTAIASGRPYFAARFLVDELGINDAGMFYTGAHLFEPRSQHTLLEVSLLVADALAVVQAAQTLDLYVEVYTPSGFYLQEQTEISRVHAAHLRVNPELDDLAAVAMRGSVSKLLVGVNRVTQGDKISILEKQFPQLIFARAYLAAYPDWQFASVISGAATKRRAFDFLLHHHQLKPHQIIAFGDAESDMDFLQMAGIGVAMGNANANIRAVADWVTKTADEAGVAYALEQLFPA